MITLEVDLGSRSYPIHIGSGTLTDAALIRDRVLSRQVMIVSNETVAPLYLGAIEAAFSDRIVGTVILADGEQFKTLDSFDLIISALLEQGFDRSCTLIALGGGVVGDVTGYAAASYQRGVDFVQIPTTLLAQVDSSVGGKTGVNIAEGKNLVGAFHQPQLVIADPATLTTLPGREYREGYAEAIKHAAIRDAAMFDALESLSPQDQSPPAELIARNIAIKARVVEEDEQETSGTRALLNFGHTIGTAWGDLNNDGRFDVVQANLAHPRFFNFSAKTQVMIAQEDGKFVDNQGDWSKPYGDAGLRFSETHSIPVLGDFDQDGNLDLVISATYDGRPTDFYWGKGDGTFTLDSYRSGITMTGGWGMAASDLDNDGDLDMLIAGHWTANIVWFENPMRGLTSR